jgi:hypothetical protein
VNKKSPMIRRSGKILIRVNTEERDYALSAMEAAGVDKSKFFRRLLKDHEEDKINNLIEKVTKRNIELLTEYNSIIKKLLKMKGK